MNAYVATASASLCAVVMANLPMSGLGAREYSDWKLLTPQISNSEILVQLFRIRL